MARQVRIEYAGAFYHVLARGDRRESIVKSDKDRQMLIDTLAEASIKTGWRIHGWVLMDNHYHWVVETPQANLVAGMKWFQNAYTRRFNSRHKLWGHVFGGRYKSIVVEEGQYLHTLVDYVHLNPVRAGLIELESAQSLLDYRWSSLAQGYCQPPGRRPDWTEVAKRLETDAGKDKVSDRRRYLNYLYGVAREEGRDAGKAASEGQHVGSTLEGGWFWGSQQFKEELLERIDNFKPANVNYRSSPQMSDYSERSAEALIASGLKYAQVGEEKLPELKGSHPAKVALAIVLKSRTTVNNIWIAQRLSMKSAGNVSQLVRRYKSGGYSLDKQWQRWINNVKNA